MFVEPAHRRRGIAQALLSALEQQARAQGLTELRLDTMSELGEALALYRSRGYVEVEPYNDNPYAEHWLRRLL